MNQADQTNHPIAAAMMKGEPTISSLVIAEITGKRHDHVLRDIENTLTDAGISAPKFGGTYFDAQNKVRPCYLLPRRECDLVISGYSVPYRLAIIDRWRELEARAQQPFEIPQTYAAALRLCADLAETSEKQSAALAVAAPKVEFYDTVTASDTVCQMAVAAQVAGLPFGRNTLFQRLREMGVMISGGARHNLPKQAYIERGLFTVKENSFDNPRSGEPVVVFTTHVTQRGIDWLVKTFAGRMPAADLPAQPAAVSRTETGAGVSDSHGTPAPTPQPA